MVTRIPRLASYRRRPPRSPLVVLISSAVLLALVLALLAPGIAAQSSSSISDPSTTTVQLGSAASAFFHLASPSSSPIWVSLSLCSPPSAFASSTSTSTLPYKLGTALYLSNSSSIQAPGPDNVRDPDDGDPDTPRLDASSGATAKLSHGLASATLDGAADGGLWLGVVAPDSAALLDGVDNATATAGDWVFELQVSSGTPLAPYVAEAAAGLRLGDTNLSTVLLTTANYSAAASDKPADADAAAAPGWQVLVAPTEPHAFALGRSQCAVRAAMQRAVGRANASATTRGYGGGTRTQFVVDGLEPATNYTAWLVANETMDGGAAGGENQTRVWDPSFFATKSGDSCRLVFDIDACPSVAYSIPAPRSLDTPTLVNFFNSTLSASLANFSRTLTTFPCGSKDNGLYSIVSTCDDCLEAYRDWQCATTLPRCTDAPSSTALNDSSAAIARDDELASWFVPQQFETTLVRDDPAASRTPLFGPASLSSTFPSLFNLSFPPTAAHAQAESPFPYSEVPPCLDVCFLVEARCPPFLGWRCPRGTADDVDGGTGSAAYGVTRTVPKGEQQADDLSRSSLGARAADRFGNVFCNALDSDLVQAAQFVPWTYSRSSAAAPRALPRRLLLLALSTLSAALGWLGLL
ncbi:hypothetical protein JCM9279_002620 [Rhodotorula babjevae]